jgi:serine/threonine protein kinase
MIYELATGNLPWEGMGGIVLVKGAEIPELPDGYSPEFRLVLEKCMSRNPADRPTTQQLIEFAENPESYKVIIKEYYHENSENDNKPDNEPDQDKPPRKVRGLLIFLTSVLLILAITYFFYLLFHD